MKKTVIFRSVTTALLAVISAAVAAEPVRPLPPLLLAASDIPAAENAAKPPGGIDAPGKPSAPKGKPLEPAIRQTVRELVSTSHEGLVEQRTSKGVGMKLKGRFRTVPVATIEEDGEITVRDYTSVPPAE